jgi:hypothetical protein
VVEEKSVKTMLRDQFKIKEQAYLDAFRKVARELATTGGDIAELARRLHARDGNPRERNKAAAAYFEQHVVGWNRYDQWLEAKRNTNSKRLEEELAEAQKKDLAALLEYRPTGEIKTLYHSIAGKRVPGKRKAEIVSALESLLNERGLSNKVRDVERRRLARKLQEKLEVRADKKEMAELFVHRVTMSFCARRRREQHLRTSESRPWWLFDAVDDDRTPGYCARLDGTVKRFDDPFWTEHPIPCERLFCRCSIRSLTDAQANEYRANV